MRPKNWGDQFLMNWLYDEVENLKKGGNAASMIQLVDAVTALSNRVGELEAEITRLEVTKANKRGPKPKNSPQG